MKLPTWKWELAEGTQSPMDSGPSTACHLLTVKRPLGAVNPASGAPLLRQPVTGDYLSPGQPHRQSWKRHGARSTPPSEKANSRNSSLPH